MVAEEFGNQVRLILARQPSRDSPATYLAHDHPGRPRFDPAPAARFDKAGTLT